MIEVFLCLVGIMKLSIITCIQRSTHGHGFISELLSVLFFFSCH